MESNREESIRCIDIAISKYNEGNLEGCIKFLNKSIALYPSERAQQLLATYTSTTTSSTTTTDQTTQSADGTTKTTHSTTSSSSKKTTETINETTSKPKYTSEQIVAIKRIKACKSFYDVLEVKKTADETDIKKAYRKLALQMHPDKNHAPGAEDAFKLVTQAFSCLSDPKKRQVYDMHGSEDVTHRSPFSRGGGGSPFGGAGGFDDEISPEDIFNIFFGIPTSGARRRGGGGAGNGYYTSSMGGSPFGNGVQFNFGGVPVNRRQQQHRQHQHRQNQQQDESSYSFLIILIPIILFLLSLFGGGNSASSVNNTNTYATLFQFTQNQYFEKERAIPIDLSNGDKINIQYWVKPDFDKYTRVNGLDVKKFESEVVNRWVVFKKPFCKKKFEYDELLRKSPTDTALKDTVSKEYKKNEYYFKYCDILNKNNVF